MKEVSTSRKYIIEFVMFFTYALFAVNWIAGSTFQPAIMKSFGIESFAMGSMVTNAITIAKIIGNLCAASILIKLQPKKAIGVASLLIAGGSAIATFAPGFTFFIIARFIMGFGGALFVVYFSPIVINYFEPEKRVLINGINGAAYNIGSIIAMVIVAPVLAWLVTWQSSMLFFSGLSGILLVMWLVLGEDFMLSKPAANADAVVEKYTYKKAFSEKFNWILPFTYSGLLTLYIAILTFFPIAKISEIDPKTLSATVALAGVVGAAAGIVYVKKATKRLPVIRFAGLAMTLFAFLMFTQSNPAIAYFSAAALGFLMFLPVTSLVTIPQELPDMSPGKLTVIMGIFWSISYVIQTTANFIFGAIVDANPVGGHKMALLVAAGFSLTFFIGSFLLPETGKKK